MAEANQTDADYREHLVTYESFLKITKWGILGVVIVLLITVWALHQA
jgi:hypothetical protein